MSAVPPPFDLPATALAFRGYNITNLGRTAELLALPRYRPALVRHLDEAGKVCSEISGRSVDLVARIERGEEAELREYDEAIAMVVAVELAHVEILRKQFGVEPERARLAFGYSLGEIVALAVGGSITFDDALRIPLTMAADCAALAEDSVMGIIFSRGAALDFRAVKRACLELNAQGSGVIGISAYLSPNSLLVLGTGDTIDRLEARLKGAMRGVSLRRNPHRWPPLHTPIVWQRHIPDRAGVLIHTLKGECRAPRPPVLSMVTGQFTYADDNVRELILEWIDRPQKLWEVLCQVLAARVTTILHLGPEPNLIPATFDRVSKNVIEQIERGSLPGRLGRRAASRIARLAWLRGVLPTRAALLRAPQVRHVRVEDWLIENAER